MNGYQVDYLCFTLPLGKNNFQRAMDMLSQFELKSNDSGLYGYQFSMTAPGVKLLYSPSRSDVHVQLSGRACDVFNVASLPSDARISRLDLAFDSYDGYYTTEDIWGYLLQGKSAGTARNKTGYMGLDGKHTGCTVYVGSQKSDVRLRIYDKAAEQGIDADKRLGFKTWTRFELQLRHEFAHATYIQFRHSMLDCLNESECIAPLFRSILSPFFFLTESVEIIEKSRKNKEQIPHCPEWDNMFSVFSVKRPKPQRRKPTLKNITKYVLDASASFKALRIVFPEFDDLFFDKVDNSPFSQKHEELLLDFAPFHADSDDAYLCYYDFPF